MIRGQADAKKTEVLNQAHAQNPSFYNLLRTLEAYEKILDEKTTLVLSTDNAIFRLLTEKVGALLPSQPQIPAPMPTANGAALPAAKDGAANPNERAKGP